MRPKLASNIVFWRRCWNHPFWRFHGLAKLCTTSFFKIVKMCVSSRRNACFSCFVFQILTSKSSKCAFRRGETLVFHLSLFKFKRQNHQNVRFVEAKRLFFIQIQTPTFTNYWFLSVRTLVRTGSERSSGRVFISQNDRPDENSIGSPFSKSTE